MNIKYFDYSDNDPLYDISIFIYLINNMNQYIYIYIIFFHGRFISFRF